MQISIKNPKIRELLDNISDTSSLIYDKGWADGNSGNISINITDLVNKKQVVEFGNRYILSKYYKSISDNYILLTVSGSRIRDLKNNPLQNLCILHINSDSKSYSVFPFGTNIKPTSEILPHLAIHNYIRKSGRSEKVVLHTHPLEVIALSQIKKYCSEKKLNNLIWKMQPESKIIFPNGIGFVPYHMTGSQELADFTVKAFKNKSVAIWEKHGCVAIGENIVTAFDKTDTLVKSLKVFFLCKSIGENPAGLTIQQIKQIEQNI